MPSKPRLLARTEISSIKDEKVGTKTYIAYNQAMEIETKIFDIKKVRKVLQKKHIEPRRVCDIVDYLFDIDNFSPKDWRYILPIGKKS
jgi:hypothetical protein